MKTAKRPRGWVRASIVQTGTFCAIVKQLEERLQDYCDISMPAFGEEPSTIVSKMSHMKVELELERFGVDADQHMDPRECLCNILSKADMIRRAECYLSFPGPQEGDLWGEDPGRVAEDGLHGTLRTPPRLFWEAMRSCLLLKYQNAHSRMKVAANAVVNVTGIRRFRVEYEAGSGNTEIVRQQFDDSECQKLLKLFAQGDISEINMWSREEMVDLFLDGICESQDVKNFIELKFPGEGACPINKAVFKLIMFKKLKGAPVTLMEQEIKDSL